MPNVGALTVHLKADSSDLNRGLDDAQNKMKNLGGKFKKVGLGMSAAITAPILGLAAFSIRTGREFEASMNTVSAITNATGKDLEALTAKARELGGSTRYSASEAAAGMQFLGMAGFNATEVLSSMNGVLQLAAASGIELGQAADITSNVMSGFRLEVSQVSRVNDVLAFSISNANTNMVEMGDAMSYLAPVASAAGMDFEESAAAIALLAKQAIKGSRAGTSLSAAMTRLMVPTHKSTAIMRKYGIETMDSEGKLKGFEEIVEELGKTGDDTGAVMALFGQRAGPSMLALMGQGSRAIGTFTEELKNAEGTTERMSDVRMAGLDGAMIELSSTFQEFGIEISERINPTLEGFADRLTDLIRGFGDLPKPVQDFILVFGGIMAVVGPAMIGIGLLIPIIYGLSTAFGVLNISLGVIALIILGVAAAIAGIVAIWQNWDAVVQFTKDFWKELGITVDIMMEEHKRRWGVFKEWLGDIWNSIWSNLTDNPVIDFFKNIIDTIIDFMNDIRDTIALQDLGLKKWWDETWEGITEFTTGLWDGITEEWEALWEGIKTFATNLWKDIKDLYTSNWGWILPGGALRKAFLFIKDNWKEIWNSIKSTATSIWGKITDAYDSNWGWILPGGAFIKAINFLKENWDKIWNGMKDVVTGIANPIIGIINTIIRAINSMLTAINDVKIASPKLEVKGKTIFEAFELQPFNIPLIGEIAEVSFPTSSMASMSDIKRMSIETMAKGGIVSRPTLAMIGESGPEAVVPLGRNGSTGTSIVINITGPTYGFDDFEKKVSMAIRDGVRRGGFQGIIAR